MSFFNYMHFYVSVNIKLRCIRKTAIVLAKLQIAGGSQLIRRIIESRVIVVSDNGLGAEVDPGYA